jgi:hypothetical protein
MASSSVIQFSHFPQLSQEPTPQALSPLAQHKYYNTDGKRLLFDFICACLAVEIIGFQSRFGCGSDLILFRSPETGSTLAVGCSVMLETCDLARQIVQSKIEENYKSFQGAA